MFFLRSASVGTTIDVRSLPPVVLLPGVFTLSHWHLVEAKRNAVRLPERLEGLGLRLLHRLQVSSASPLLRALIRGASHRQCIEAKRKDTSESEAALGKTGIIHFLQYLDLSVSIAITAPYARRVPGCVLTHAELDICAQGSAGPQTRI